MAGSPRARGRLSPIILLVAASLVIWGCAAAEDGGRRPGDVVDGNDGANPAGGAETSDAGQAAAQSARAHPDYALSREELTALADESPRAVRDAIAEDPVRFLELVDAALALPADRTLLVDKDHPLPEEYAPADLVELDTLAARLALSRPGHRLTAPATEALLAMSADASRDGVTLVASSAYRSYAYQADVFARWVDELGLEEAARVSARPGTSQHQLGTALDFGCICDAFASQPAGRWLAENAHRHGFSLSYPDGYEEVTGYSYEPWHFRYIGAETAALEREYFAGIQQWMLEFLHENRPVLEDARDEPRDES